MENSLATVIQYMIKSFGIEIMKDDSRFWAVFLDLSPQMDRERKMIKRICDEHLLERFFAITLAPKNDCVSIMNSLKSELTINQGFSEAWANELIEAFGEGFGIESTCSTMVNENRTKKTENSSIEAYIIQHFYPDNKEGAKLYYYREQLGLSLREVVDAIDKLWIEAYIVQNYYPASKVSAVVYYREQNGVSLREAKDAVDRLWIEMGRK